MGTQHASSLPYTQIICCLPSKMKLVHALNALVPCNLDHAPYCLGRTLRVWKILYWLCNTHINMFLVYYIHKLYVLYICNNYSSFLLVLRLRVSVFQFSACSVSFSLILTLLPFFQPQCHIFSLSKVFILNGHKISIGYRIDIIYLLPLIDHKEYTECGVKKNLNINIIKPFKVCS